MIKGTNYINYVYFRAKTEAKLFALKHERVLETLASNVSMLPVVAAATLALLKLSKIPFVIGICWEKNLRIDVANAVRQKILKDLTGEEGFSELLELAEPSIKKAVEEIFSELVALERQGNYIYRAEFQSRINEFVDKVLVKAWNDIEPKIQDANKKARLMAWMDRLKSELSGVDAIQQRAADLLRETTREILYDFNGKAEETLGQSIPGEIEGTGEDHAMHILAETIVEKIMDRDLDFEVAIRQVVAEVMKEGVIDASGQENLVRELLIASRSNNGTTLTQLFEDFRRDFLDPGPGKLRLPKKAGAQAEPNRSAIERRTVSTQTGKKTDGNTQ
ncbi:MAG: hypothetical protein WC632_01425 [Candidatus Margulisiibacteriota bacterium]